MFKQNISGYGALAFPWAFFIFPCPFVSGPVFPASCGLQIRDTVRIQFCATIGTKPLEEIDDLALKR
jgi:hypothetical protein